MEPGSIRPLAEIAGGFIISTLTLLIPLIILL
jgi:hypothetical protein